MKRPCRCALIRHDVSPAELMRACGGLENRREWALRIFHLGDGCSFSPLVFCAGGVAMVRSFYKSSRRGVVSFLLLSHKKALPRALSFAAVFSTPPPKAPLFSQPWPAMMCDQVSARRPREGRDPPSPHGCRAAIVDRSLGERQGAKPTPGLCGLLPVIPRPGVQDSGRSPDPSDS